MRVNQPDGTVRDEVVIVGGSGQAVGMNGDRLKVDANLNVDEVTVSNVGITSVDGAGMEQAGEYMPVKGEVELTGSIVPDDQAVPVRGVQKVEIETIINAESVATSGNTGMKTFDGKGADLIYLLINVDQAWHALARAPWATATVGLKLLYPDVSTSQTARPTLSYPDIVLYTLAGADGIGAATTLTDAAQHALAWRTADLSSSNMGVIIYNDGNNTASVTVKVLRIWR